MAITKLLRLKESKKGNKASHLKRNLFYICDPDKCEGGLLIGSNAGTRPEIIYETMMENKKEWDKEYGTQAFHYVISFPPELGVKEALAFRIAQDFTDKLLGDEYYYAFAVHNDHEHMHVHITFDSVSRVDGHKFHSPKGDWERRIQPITDEICEKYQLPPLTFGDEKKGKNYRQWKSDRDREKGKAAGDISWYDLIRSDIDRAIYESGSFEEVLSFLNENGYQVKLGKYLSLRPFGKERAVRTSRLGEEYTISSIKERVRQKTKSYDPDELFRYILPDEIIAVFRIKRTVKAGWTMTPFQRSFYQRWRNSFLRNRPGRPSPWRYNQDAVRIRRLSNAIKYMIDQNINDPEDLEGKRESILKKKEDLDRQLRSLYSLRSRKSPLRELGQYERKKDQIVGEPSEEEKEKMDALLEEINAAGGMENAKTQLKEVKEKIELLRKKRKEVIAEEKLLNDLSAFYFDKPAPQRQEEKTMEAERNIQPEETAKGGHPWQLPRTRVTIHQKLIKRQNPDGSFLIRLPGREELFTLPGEDTYRYKSGQILSAFIYDDEDYEVSFPDGQDRRLVPGSELKKHFTAKKDRKKGER